MSQYKDNFFGYFKFYYGVLGNSTLIYLAICVLVSILDGFGIAMFIPILEFVGKSEVSEQESMGQFRFLVEGVKWIGLSINLVTVSLVLVSLFSVKAVIRYWQLRYQTKLRFKFIQRIRYQLLDRLQALSYAGFLKLDAGRIQNTFTAEAQRLFQTMHFYFSAAQSFVMLMTYILLAFAANYQFAALVVVGAGSTNFIYRRIYRSTKRASSEYSKKGHDFNSYLIQAVSSFKYLKSTGYFSHYAKKVKSVIDQSEMLNRKMGNLTAITTSMREPLILSVILAVILLQVEVMGASLTTILLSLLLFYRALSFLVVVQNHWQNFIINAGSIESVDSLLFEMNLHQENSSLATIEKIRSDIQLKNIDFAYGDRMILNNISLSIPVARTVALVGESGAGKTTLANIIAGLIEPGRGSVCIDNVNLKELNIHDYRIRIGYISQEPVIFNDSVYNNITFWSPPTEENLSKFKEVIRLTSLDTFLEGLSEGENTLLGDNGILISGGQRQRISIARELFKKPEILILDEATSSLDAETELVIKENIKALHGLYTMIIIAHRLSTIKEADIIYVIEKGSVTDFGDYDMLLSKSEKFKRMVSLQEV